MESDQGTLEAREPRGGTVIPGGANTEDKAEALKEKTLKAQLADEPKNGAQPEMQAGEEALEASEGAPPASSNQAFKQLRTLFADPSRFYRSLTYRSYLNEHPEVLEDNERLEFLGDAVLDFIVGAWVYNRFPEMREGELTKIRSAIVRNDQLAIFARQLNLGPALRLGRGEYASGGRQRQGGGLRREKRRRGQPQRRGRVSRMVRGGDMRYAWGLA